MKNEDIYNWVVVIFGPPKTLYEGGYFKAEMTFPTDYPYRLVELTLRGNNGPNGQL